MVYLQQQDNLHTFFLVLFLFSEEFLRREMFSSISEFVFLMSIKYLLSFNLTKE